MALRQFTNGGVTTLSGSMNGSSNPVTFTVASATGFPTSGNFSVIIEDEILLVTAVAGTSFTASRAQEGTTIAAHASGVDVNQSLTALSLTEIIQRVSWRPYKLFTPAGIDDEFDDENFSGWTAVGTTPVPTVSEQNSQLSVKHPGGDAAARFYAYMKSATISAGDWIEICFRALAQAENYPIIGLVFADGVTVSSGTQVALEVSSQETQVIIRRTTGYNTNKAQSGIGLNVVPPNSHLILRFTYNGSNSFTADMSLDGVQYLRTHTAAGHTLTPTYCGFWFSKWGGASPAQWVLEYFRKGS